MMKLRAVARTATGWACALVAASLLASAPAGAAWDEPWTDSDKALVIDAYEFNPIEWGKLTSDERIAGFINKASDGLPPEWNCNGLDGDDWKLCKNRWWKYSVTKELYQTRREMAKIKGLLWGAYHLARPGNPIEQADHFLRFADPGPNDLIALDIEDLSDEWMSLDDAEIFARRIKARVGRYPVLYTNGNTADHIADNAADYPILSRLPIWYARYRDDITGHFPEKNWPTYALWQFSSMHNCNASRCPYRVSGASTNIDVNVASTDAEGLRAAWPFGELIDRLEPEVPMLVADISEETKAAVRAGAEAGRDAAAKMAETALAALKTHVGPGDATVPGTVAAAYGPGRQHGLDPLKLLSKAARHPAEAPSAVARDIPAASQDDAAASGNALLSVPQARSLGGHVDAMRSQVSRAVSRIDRFLGGATAPIDAQVLRENTASKTTSSKFAAMLAEAERAAAASPATVIVDKTAAPRPARAAQGGRIDGEVALAADERIASTFALTRQE